MRSTILAQRYAKALFDLAIEMKQIEEVYRDMGLLQVTISESMEFRQFLISPVIKADKKVAVLNALFKGKVAELTQKFFELLAQNRREENLKMIAREFIELYKEFKNITTVNLKTAVPVSDSVKKDILDKLSKYTGGSIDLIEEVDENLIGGFLVNIEETQYDASLLRVFNQLRKEFEVNLYIREI